MTVPRKAKLDDVLKMLDACAPGHTRRETDHYISVRFMGQTYPRLPLGAHGARRPETGTSQVRGLVRQLGLDRECVRQFFPWMPDR